MRDERCSECGKLRSEHVWPEMGPCPKCGQTEPVTAWEAWGCPNGELYCASCLGYDSAEPQTADYWTFSYHDGTLTINPWTKQPTVTASSGLMLQGHRFAPTRATEGEQP